MIRVALIGLGKMGASHLAIIRSHPDVELVAVCDTSKYIVDILEKYTGVKTYTDYREMLRNEPLDAVVIATPSRFHAETIRAALERDIHVFCEKPFCLDLDDAKSLADTAQAKNLVNQVGYHYRFMGALREARRLLDAGAIGEVHHIRAEAYGPVVLRPKGETWRTSKIEGGGCLYDYASHAIDLMNYLVGPPASVRGSVLNRIFSRDVDDEVYATLCYDGGMTGQLAANWSDDSTRKMSMKVTIWGKQGRINADRQEVQIYRRGEGDESLGLQSGWNVKYTTEVTDGVWYYLRGEEYSAQMDFFLKQIKSGTRDIEYSFISAMQTDVVIHQIIADANGDRGEGQNTSPVRDNRSGTFGRLFGARI